MFKPRKLRRQKGVALLYVLLLFAIITMMASKIIHSLWLHTDKNAHYLERTQAKHYALGAEQYVAGLLEKDFKQDQADEWMLDHFSEAWHVYTVNYPITQGEISILVDDLQSYININDLAEASEDNKIATSIMQTLFTQLSLDSSLVHDVTQYIQIADQASKDDEEQNNDKEALDIQYLALEPPRRAANTHLSDVSELKLITGLTESDVATLSPYLVALPNSSKININTAPAQVLAALSPKMDQGSALQLILARDDKPFDSIEALQSLLTSEQFNDLPTEKLSMNSQYFKAQIEVQYRDTTFYLQTHFYRNQAGNVQVIHRRIGPRQTWFHHDNDDRH